MTWAHGPHGATAVRKLPGPANALPPIPEQEENVHLAQPRHASEKHSPMISQTLLSPQAAPFWPGRKEHPGKRARFSTALLTATEAADAAGGAPASSQADAETASRNEAGLGHTTIAGQPNITQPSDARVDQLPGRRLGASWEPEEGCTGFQEPRVAARPRMVIESSPTPVLQNRFSVLATEVAEP